MLYVREAGEDYATRLDQAGDWGGSGYRGKIRFRLTSFPCRGFAAASYPFSHQLTSFDSLQDPLPKRYSFMEIVIKLR